MSDARFQPKGIAPTDEQLGIQLGRHKRVIVEANAGAAKTTTLALRLAQALARGADVHRILALTYTEAAVLAFTQALERIGVPAATRKLVKIRTFDDFCRAGLQTIEGGSVHHYDAPEQLKRELADRRYKVRPIAMGTNTDPYQPAERKHKLTREILKVLLETRHPATITTKSALVVRDLDILQPMAELGLVRVGLSVTSMDHKLSRKMEPRASTPEKRLEALRLLSEAGVPTMVMAAPIVPAINDMELERIIDAAAAQGVRSAHAIMVRLPGEVRDIFREWLLRHFPDRVRHVMNLVRDVRGGKDNDPNFGTRFVGEGPFAVLMQQRLEKARERHGLNQAQPPLRTDLFVSPRLEDAQLNLF